MTHFKMLLRRRLYQACRRAALSTSLTRSVIEQAFIPYIKKDCADFLPRIRLSPEKSTMLEELSRATVEELEAGVTAVTLSSKTLIDPFNVGDVLPHTLFKRKFFGDYLEQVCACKNVVVLGSAGISKSTWQYLYLHSLVTDSVFWEKQNKPKLVIQRFGATTFYFYDLETKVVYESTEKVDLGIFRPESVVYLYEPGITLLTGPDQSPLKTIATLSPDPRRYKEFVKHGASELYFPTYSEEELQAIGKRMHENSEPGDFGDFVRKEYTVEKIKKRYELYGGIFRRVLPRDASAMKRHLSTLDSALRKSYTLAELQDVEMISQAGSFVVQWNPVEDPDGKYDFSDLAINYASEHALLTLKQKSLTRGFGEMKNDLVGIYENTPQNQTGKHIFENFVVSGLNGHFEQTRSKWPLKSIVRGVAPYASMEAGVLYYPVDTTYPAADAYFKNDDKLYAIQVSWTKDDKKKCTIGALAMFLDKIKFPANKIKSKLQFVFARVKQPASKAPAKWVVEDKDYTTKNYVDAVAKYKLKDTSIQASLNKSIMCLTFDENFNATLE